MKQPGSTTTEMYVCVSVGERYLLVPVISQIAWKDKRLKKTVIYMHFPFHMHSKVIIWLMEGHTCGIWGGVRRGGEHSGWGPGGYFIPLPQVSILAPMSTDLKITPVSKRAKNIVREGRLFLILNSTGSKPNPG